MRTCPIIKTIYWPNVKDVEYITTKECNKRGHYNGNIRDGMFCAASRGKDSCNGDNGSAAKKIYEGRDNTLLLCFLIETTLDISHK